jgi:hypothetical protein
MSAQSFKATWRIAAPKGHNRIAQGFSPGMGGRKSALKVAPDVWASTADRHVDKYRALQRCALKAQWGWCTSSSFRMVDPVRVLSGATFRAHPMATRYPGVKPWAVLLCPFGAVDECEYDKENQPHP